jgi:serine/threonine-protein kinase HipA
VEARFVESLTVLKENHPIGVLSRTESGALFTYDEETRLSLSYTMPRERNTYECRGINLHPFFAGLLPEGLRLHALQTAVKTSRDDLFSLLVASGADTIGDISFSESASREGRAQTDSVRIEEVIFEELFQQKVLLHGPKDNLVVAGIQPKVSGAMISFPLRVANKNKAYIVKLAPKEFPRIIENEAFFMQLAQQCGIATPATQIVTDKEGTRALLVERFDRHYDKKSSLVRHLHQEDACQFLDRYPADKYRLSLSEILEGVRKYATTPIVDSAALLRIVAFSYIIGNGDLHAKNISLYENPATGYRTISPAYDLLSTVIYGDTKMALMIEGRDDSIKRRDFIALGARFSIPLKVVNSMLDKLIKHIAPAIDNLAQIGFDEKKRMQLEKVMVKRGRDLMG